MAIRRTTRRADGTRRKRLVDGWLAGETPWRAALVGSAVLVLAFGAWYVHRQAGAPRLNEDPSIAMIGGPQPGACAVAAADSAVLGEIRGVLGRDGEPLMYRVQGFRRVRGRGRTPAVDFPRDVWIRDVRVVPCAATRGRAVYRG
jgi:hypothetical protein